MAGEMVPASPRKGRLSATTCVGLLRLHVTPSQLQKSALLFQEASILELLSLTLKATSAASSLAAAITRMEKKEANSKLISHAAMSFPELVEYVNRGNVWHLHSTTMLHACVVWIQSEHVCIWSMN
ncbi:hypothetical protein VPH35_042053 [Triticum aestivum]